MRLFFGQFLSLIGASEVVRDLYFILAKRYLSKSNGLLKGAWIRRSCTTEDFFPLTSDIDLTVLVELADLPALISHRYLYPRHLIQDVQIVAVPFFQDWLETGGIRNRQISSWRTLMSSEFQLKSPESEKKSDIAFEIAHEIFLIFTQLAESISQNNSRSSLKLKLELERLLQFWNTGDKSLLLVSRRQFQKFIEDKDFGMFLSRHEKFWDEILQALEKPMAEYPLNDLMKSPKEETGPLYLKIRNRDVILVKNVPAYLKVAEENPDDFIATPNFIRLLKGVGIQEQTLLNKTANTKNPYYIKFNRQRLAHDLIGTLLQDIENESRVYYCFRNNQEFLDSFGWGSAPHWEELMQGPEGKIPWSREELLRKSLANLEVLMRVG